MAEPNAASDVMIDIPKTEKPENMPWYISELKEDMIDPAARELFENYCKVPSADVIPHIKQFRDEAFKVHPYPCLALFSFLEFALATSKHYPSILTRVKSGAVYLDIGCCVAQDIRKLVHDGAPSSQTYGTDLQAAFMDIGYDLFLDRDTLKTTFIGADIFDESDASGLKVLEGKVDIVHTAFFFHLFDLEGQTQAVRRVVKLFRDQVGCLLVGRQLGNVKTGTIGSGRYRHDPESFRSMWEIVGKETGTEWKVDAWLGDEDLWDKAREKGAEVKFLPPGSRVLNFAVERVK